MPVLILLVIMAFSGVWPLGSFCILRTDMYHQYAPFFSEFRDKLSSGRPLTFTWNLGLGVNFTAIMAYYLANPLNWLVVLFPKDHVIEFMTLLVLFKTGLCSALMTVYLCVRSCPAKALSPRREGETDGSDAELRFGAFWIGLFYGLSAYVCAYYWNLMWFDSIALFPLIILGLERMLQGRSGVLYGAALGLSIFSNYYISILICLFLVLWFFLYSILELPSDGRAFFRNGARFAFWSLIAGGLAAVFLLPEVHALKSTASSDINFPKILTDYFSVLKMLSRHLIGVETEQGLDHWPNIYCGCFLFLALPLYISNTGIPLKEKVIYLGTAFFFLMSFAFNILNFVWHGLHYPNSLPARQSFIYIFLLLVMSFRVYTCRRAIRKKELTTALLLASAFLLAAENAVQDDAIHFLCFYGSFLLILLYAGVCHLYLKRSVSVRGAGIMLVGLALLELSVNTAYTSVTTTSRESYTRDNADCEALLSEIADPDFYRVEKKNRKTKNDGAWLHFPSVSIFSSMANADGTAFFKKLGCEASTNAYSITGSTPLIDMLLDVKYALYGSRQEENPGEELIAAGDEAALYRNTYALPLGFMMPEAMTEGWIWELDDPVLLQNSICDALHTPQVLKPIPNPGSSADGSYAVTLPEDGVYYAYLGTGRIRSVTVNWPTKKKTLDNLDRKYLIELGTCKKGDLIRMTAEKEDQKLEPQIYRFDYEALGRLYEVLHKGALSVSEFTDTSVSGTVTVDTAALGYSSNRAMIFLSIPYDEGWKVEIDGEPVLTYKALDALLSFYLSDGPHQIEMHYEPKGLFPGRIISILSAMVLAAGFVRIYMQKRRKRGKIVIHEITPALEAEEGENT